MDLNKSQEKRIFFYEEDVSSKVLRSEQHYHSVFEMYFMVSGECKYFIDNKCYEVTKNDLVIIPDGITHNVVYISESHTRKLISCSKNYIPRSVIPHLHSLTYIYRNPKISEQISQIFDKIAPEYSSPDQFSEDVIKTLIASLFFLLARNAETRLEVKTGISYIEKAVRFIQENFTSSITLSDIAKLNSVSPEHLSREFKKETGFGFNEYLNMLRLQKAEALLKTKRGLSVSDIAYSCGFNDSNYFSDKFKREYGYPPSALRKK